MRGNLTPSDAGRSTHPLKFLHVYPSQVRFLFNSQLKNLSSLSEPRKLYKFIFIRILSPLKNSVNKRFFIYCCLVTEATQQCTYYFPLFPFESNLKFLYRTALLSSRQSQCNCKISSSSSINWPERVACCL